jgi:hypothetical protein
VGFVKHAVHCLGTAIVTFSANRIVPRDLKFGSHEDEDARTGMYDEWMGDLASVPPGSIQQKSSSLQTICTAVKFHSLVKKERYRTTAGKKPWSLSS